MLGDFGTAHDPVDESFGYFGEEFRVHPDLSSTALNVLFEGDATIRDLVAAMVHPDDVGAFWTVAAANRQTYGDLSRLSWEIVAALAERPTLLPSDSSDGQQATEARSESEQALTLLQGRPDLAAVIVMQEREAV